MYNVRTCMYMYVCISDLVLTQNSTGVAASLPHTVQRCSITTLVLLYFLHTDVDHRDASASAHIHTHIHIHVHVRTTIVQQCTCAQRTSTCRRTGLIHTHGNVLGRVAYPCFSCDLFFCLAHWTGGLTTGNWNCLCSRNCTCA